MKTRRKVALGSILAVCVVCALVSGCCLTRRLWQSVADEPQKLVGASLTSERVLHLVVRYEDGRLEHLVADLPPGPDWSRATARIVDPPQGALPASSGLVDISYRFTEDTRGGRSHTVWVDGAGCKSVVTLPEPVDWSSATPYIAVAASPFTFLVDLYTVPQQSVQPHRPTTVPQQFVQPRAHGSRRRECGDATKPRRGLDLGLRSKTYSPRRSGPSGLS